MPWKSHQSPPISARNGGTSTCHGAPPVLQAVEVGCWRRHLSQSSASHSPFHPSSLGWPPQAMPTPNPFPSAQPHLTTSAGSLVPAREMCLREQAWLKNSLMSGEMIFTLLKRMGTTWHHLPPRTRHPLGATPPSRHPRAYLWEYTFLERSRWMRLVWDPWSRAPKSCQGGDVSHVEGDPESLQPLTKPRDGGGLRAGLTAWYSQHPKDNLCQPG